MTVYTQFTLHFEPIVIIELNTADHRLTENIDAKQARVLDGILIDVLEEELAEYQERCVRNALKRFGEYKTKPKSG